MTPAEKEIARAFTLVDKVLQPLSKGDGEAKDVKAARVAVQCLHLLRQHAKRGAAGEGPFLDRLRLFARDAIVDGRVQPEIAAAFIAAVAPPSKAKRKRAA